MTHMIHCAKLHKEAKGLDSPPYPGELGEKIYAAISKEAWGMWLGHQTMLINEYRLNLADPKARAFLAEEMEKFLFSDESTDKPPGFVPPTAEN